MRKIVFLLCTMVAAGLWGFRSQAQIRQLPQAVKDAFEQKYPDAKQVDYDDKIIYVLAQFKNHDSTATARFSSKGAWQWTETQMPFTGLPEAVQDGFNKSKYVDWQVDHVYLVELPGDLVQYKLQVEKSAVQKKNLYFSTRGRLLSDGITMY